MLNGAIDYTTPIGNYTFFARLDGSYQSETRNAISLSPLFNVDLDGFAIFNAVATVSSDTWDLSFWVKNIGNEEGATGRYTEAYMGTDPAEGYFGNGSKDLISLPLGPSAPHSASASDPMAAAASPTFDVAAAIAHADTLLRRGKRADAAAAIARLIERRPRARNHGCCARG